jgi:hypothetical protein
MKTVVPSLMQLVSRPQKIMPVEIKGSVLATSWTGWRTRGPTPRLKCPSRNRQPEGAEHRALKPLPDIVEGEAAPQLIEPGAVKEIGEGLRRHRFRGYAGDGRFLLG